MPNFSSSRKIKTCSKEWRIDNVPVPVPVPATYGPSADDENVQLIKKFGLAKALLRN